MHGLIWAIALLCGWPLTAQAFDGWHQEGATVIEGKVTGFDYITFDGSRNRLFLGRRKEGLQVFDIATRKVVKTIDKTPEHSSNGALLLPEFDLAISTNEDGTITPFKLSTLETMDAVQVTKELDASFYDPLTKRIFANSDHGGDIFVLEVPSFKQLGVITLPTKMLEHGVADGRGSYYLAARDIDRVFKIDTRTMKVAAEFATGPACGYPNSLAINEQDNRILIGCRGHDRAAPSFAVLDAATGKITFSLPMGGGNDNLIYDPELKRVFAANGVAAHLMVLEPVKPDEYRLVEALGTRPMVKTIAMDHKAKKIYAFMAESSADALKKINTTIGPFYPNTYFPNTFTVLSYSR